MASNCNTINYEYALSGVVDWSVGGIPTELRMDHSEPTGLDWSSAGLPYDFIRTATQPVTKSDMIQRKHKKQRQRGYNPSPRNARMRGLDKALFCRSEANSPMSARLGGMQSPLASPKGVQNIGGLRDIGRGRNLFAMQQPAGGVRAGHI